MKFMLLSKKSWWIKIAYSGAKYDIPKQINLCQLVRKTIITLIAWIIIGAIFGSIGGYLILSILVAPILWLCSILHYWQFSDAFMSNIKYFSGTGAGFILLFLILFTVDRAKEKYKDWKYEQQYKKKPSEEEKEISVVREYLKAVHQKICPIVTIK
jgi:large-conductance mechanosensitive channel